MVQVTVMPGTDTPDHHGNHQALLWDADGNSPKAEVHAVIVPTARPVPHLKEAAAVALSLGCPLVTVHSQKWTSAHEASHYLGRAVDLIAIDLPDAVDLRLPELETTRLLAGTVFERRTDTSTKRNLALVLSNKLAWERVVFLDDDIKVPDPADFSRAAGQLDTHTAAGLRNAGYPDNSVVCHAFRAAGGNQGQFIGGGALAVEVKRNNSFFPSIYNEDWFYVLDGGKRLQSVAMVGRVIQRPYDPYRTTDRARGEEFGDVLAEGAFWLLDQAKTVSDGGIAHWRDFLRKRRRLIEHVLDTVKRSDAIDPAEQGRMIEALKAALGRSKIITPELCVAYMNAWVADQERWRRHIEYVRQQPALSREEALASLVREGKTLTWCTNQQCSTPARAFRDKAGRAVSPRRFQPLTSSDLQSANATLDSLLSTVRRRPPSPKEAMRSRVTSALSGVVPSSQLSHSNGDGYDDQETAQAVAL